MGPGGGGPTLWLAQQASGRRGRASNSAQDGELAVERPPGTVVSNTGNPRMKAV